MRTSNFRVAAVLQYDTHRGTSIAMPSNFQLIINSLKPCSSICMRKLVVFSNSRNGRFFVRVTCTTVLDECMSVFHRETFDVFCIKCLIQVKCRNGFRENYSRESFPGRLISGVANSTVNNISFLHLSTNWQYVPISVYELRLERGSRKGGKRGSVVEQIGGGGDQKTN